MLIGDKGIDQAVRDGGEQKTKAEILVCVLAFERPPPVSVYQHANIK